MKAFMLRFLAAVLVLGLMPWVSWDPPKAAASHPSGFRLPFVGHGYFYTYSGHLGGANARDIKPKTPNAWDGSVRAAADGIVIWSGEYDARGFCPFTPATTYQKRVIVEHVVTRFRYVTVYEHLSSIAVSKGDIVTAGQFLGQWGNTGCSTGTHLHFALHNESTSTWGRIPSTSTTVNIDDLPGVSSRGNSAPSGDALGPGLLLADANDKRTIGFGQSLSGTINRNNDQDSYYFNGTAGQRPAIRLTSGSFDAYLHVFRPNGQLLDDDDDGGDGTNSLVQMSLPETGRYRIVATSYYSTTQNASYTLSVQGGDTTAPSVAWASPTTDGAVYSASSGTVSLRVNASDNVGVARVDFWRYSYNRWGLGLSQHGFLLAVHLLGFDFQPRFSVEPDLCVRLRRGGELVLQVLLALPQQQRASRRR